MQGFILLSLLLWLNTRNYGKQILTKRNWSSVFSDVQKYLHYPHILLNKMSGYSVIVLINIMVCEQLWADCR